MPYVWEDSLWVRKDDYSPSIIIFGRNTERPREVVRTIINGVEPYFYFPANATMVPRGIKRVEGKIYVDALGRNVYKAFVELPSDVPKLRESFEWTDEADVMFDIRYMIDNGITYAYEDTGGKAVPSEVTSITMPRIMMFDIEVRSPSTIIPKPEDACWPIVSIQCGDSYDKDIVVFTVGVPQTNDEEHIACNNEVELLGRFMNYVQERNFDVLTGWYSNGFDMPYIINRAEKLGVNLNKLTRLPGSYSKPRAVNNGRSWFIKVPGRQCVDMMEAFKKWYKAKGELEKYDLKSVVANDDIMKDAAFEYTDYGAHIDELFVNENWGEFIQYCKNDVIALTLIDDTIKLFSFYEFLRMKTGVKLEDTMKNSKMIESVLFHDSVMKPMPTRKYDVAGETYSGALVITPKVGLHKNIGVFDLTALYPTIMRAFKISPDIDGVVPRVIVGLMEEREKLRALKKAGLADESTQNKETVVKFLVNSFYGVLGWPQFRLYRPELAEKITSTGREINEFLQKCTRELNSIPVYGDTDSVFITGIDTVEIGIETQNYFNSRLKEWAEEKGAVIAPSLKFEKLYRKILFKQDSSGKGAAKKRYAGHIVWKEGEVLNKLSYTGIELKRSDQSEITREVLEKFLVNVLVMDDIDAALSCVRDAHRDVKSGNISVYKCSIPRGMRSFTGNNPWARGVANTEMLFGIKFPEGVKPRLVYVKGDIKEICINDEISEEDVVRLVRIDWFKIQEKVIENKMRSFVESIGIMWDAAVNGQQTMDRWMNYDSCNALPVVAIGEEDD